MIGSAKSRPQITSDFGIWLRLLAGQQWRQRDHRSSIAYFTRLEALTS